MEISTDGDNPAEQSAEERRWEDWLNMQAALFVAPVLAAHFPDEEDLSNSGIRERLTASLQQQLAAGLKVNMHGGLRRYLNNALDESLAEGVDESHKELLKQKLRSALKSPLRQYLDARLTERLEEYWHQLKVELQEYYGSAVDEDIDRRNALEVERLRLNPLVIRRDRKTLDQWLEDRHYEETTEHRLQAVGAEMERLRNARGDLQTRITDLTQQLAVATAVGASTQENSRPPAARALSEVAIELSRGGLSDGRKRELLSRQQALLRELTVYGRRRPRTREEIEDDLRGLAGDFTQQILGELPDVEQRLNLREQEAITLLAEMRAQDREQLKVWLREGITEDDALHRLERERGKEQELRVEFMTRGPSLELRENAAQALRQETQQLTTEQIEALSTLAQQVSQLKGPLSQTQWREHPASLLLERVMQQKAKLDELKRAALSSEERPPFQQERLLRRMMWRREELSVLEEELHQLQQEAKQQELMNRPREIVALRERQLLLEKVLQEVEELTILSDDAAVRRFKESLKDEHEDIDWIVSGFNRTQDFGDEPDLSAAREHLIKIIGGDPVVRAELRAVKRIAAESSQARQRELQTQLDAQETIANGLLQTLQKDGDWPLAVTRDRDQMRKRIESPLIAVQEMLDALEDAQDADEPLPHAQLEAFRKSLPRIEEQSFNVMVWERKAERGAVVRDFEKLHEAAEGMIERLNDITALPAQQMEERNKLLSKLILRQYDIQSEMEMISRPPISDWDRVEQALDFAAPELKKWQGEKFEDQVKSLEQ
ncbi:MAG TPA: hypothetical protein VM532_04770, partial [Burkholderiales bacterium]|nr:hypothetical protein [Burkholderiales bacterium]